MQYKLFCTDIDGTLLSGERELSSKTIEVIHSIDQQWMPVVLVSARMPMAMRHLQVELDIQRPIVCFNGALILGAKDEEILLDDPLKPNFMEDIILRADLLGLHCSLYSFDEWFVPSMDYWAKREENNTKVSPKVQSYKKTLDHWAKKDTGAHKFLIMGEEQAISRLEMELNEIHGYELGVYRSKNTYLEVNIKSANKGLATSFIAKHFKVMEEELICAGDNYNDIEMLKRAGLSLVVDNAPDAVKAVGDQIIKANTEDGVADYLQNRFLL